MRSSLKYIPKNFEDILGMADDLTSFYICRENYLIDKTQNNRFDLERQAYQLFFTIKHRMLEGALTQTTAKEIIEYMEELMND